MRYEVEVSETDRKGWRWQIVRGGRVLAESTESYRRAADARRAGGRFARGVYLQLVAGGGFGCAGKKP